MSSVYGIEAFTSVRYCVRPRPDMGPGASCDFEGDVEIFHDFETSESSWGCPECGAIHLEYVND